TALTLYREAGESPSHEMFRWTAANLPSAVRAQIDYALVSYYDNDFSIDWEPIFRQLAQTFPNAKVGFGEMGGDDTQSDRKKSIQWFYALRLPNLSSFVAGNFYWYYCADMVPRTGPLWQVLSDGLGAP